jgi:hypothetical protein
VKKYADQGQYPVRIDAGEIQRIGCRLVTGNIMSAPDLIRHDSEKLAQILLSLASC